MQLHYQPTALFCLLLKLEIKPFTSIFDHKTTVPDAVVFFSPLKQQSTQVKSPGKGERWARQSFSKQVLELHLLIKDFNISAITSNKPSSTSAVSPAGKTAYTLPLFRAKHTCLLFQTAEGDKQQC